MSFLPYPKYKASGVEWLGQVPTHWILLPAKRSFSRRKELNKGMKCENRLALTMGGVVPRDLNDLDGLQASEFETYQLFQKDDLVFKLIDLQNIKTSRVGLVPELGIMSPAYIRLEPYKDQIFPKFAYWFFTDLYNRCIFNELGGGVRQTLTAEELLLLPFPSPAFSEQIEIATFLDQETAKIDTLVAEQRRLMELLKEKRQTIISHAVTKGLDFDTPLKPSGIEWLGNVPEHWTIARLSYFAAIENGTTPSRDNTNYWLDGDVPWLSSGEVNQYRITEATEFITKKALDECSLRLLSKGTIVIGMIGQGKTRGLSASLEIEATINQNLAAIVPGNNLVSDYLLYIFQSVYEYLRELGRGGNQAALNCEILSALKVPIPPPEEQLQICEHLYARLNEFDTLVTEAQRAVDLLQERRTALISAAVTGQIDVRQIVEKNAA